MESRMPTPLDRFAGVDGFANLGESHSNAFSTRQRETLFGLMLSHADRPTSQFQTSIHSSGLSRGVRLSTRGSRQRLIGTASNDILNASSGAGKNLLKGNAGNDKLFAGKSDRLFGDAGNDVLDARKGKGGNFLTGGAGNDTLYAKSADKLDAGQGNDILWAGLGSNQLKGGRGADQFWIANRSLPKKVNIIKDFDLSADVLGISNVPGVIRFSDLTLTQQGQDTSINYQGKAIALLSGITANSLTSQHFIGLQPSLPALSISNGSVSERDTGTTTATLEVTLSTASSVPITVEYSTVAGTATADVDYTSTIGTLTFAPGETSQVIAIDIINDTQDELDEIINVVLSNSTNAILANTQAQLTIIDNDITQLTAKSTQSDGSKTNNIDALYDFDLYDITAAGDYRRDEEGNPNNDVGIFSGAIENFTGLIREVGVDPFLKFNGLKIGGTTSASYDLFIPEALTFDLKAQFIPRGGTIVLPDGSTEIASSDRVEYRLTNDRLRNEAGLFEWTLILSSGLIDESVIDPIKAVNSIEYMIANQLLAKANLVRFSIVSKADPQKLYVVNDAIDPVAGNQAPPPPRVVTRDTPPAIPRPVPYNDAIAPINDTIPNASDTGIRPNGFRRFSLMTEIGVPNNSAALTRDVDFFKVQLNAGEVININIDSFSAVDSRLRIFNANGVQLASSDNNAGPGESVSIDPYIEFQVSSTGTYYIGVSGSNNAAYNPFVANSGTLGSGGVYTIKIDVREPNNTIARAMDTELNDTPGFYGTTTQIGDSPGIAPGADVDLYKVQLNAGDTLAIDIDTYDFPANVDRLDDSYIRVFDTLGVQLAFNNDAPSPLENASPTFRDSYLLFAAPATGAYYIGVSAYPNLSYDPLTGISNAVGSSTGFYKINLSRSNS